MDRLGKLLYAIAVGFVIGIVALITAVLTLRVVFELAKFIDK
jgi:hypothetical protein